MTRHLLRLIWNRKRQNFLLTLEIFFSFLTLFGVVLFAMQYANNARQPLGFTIDRVWSVSVDRKESADDPAVKARHRETYRQLLTALRELPQIEVVAGAFTGPYANSNWGGDIRLVGGRRVDHGVNRVTDDFLELFHVPLVAGRWFSREDDAASWTPVVLNRHMAEEIFGDQNPIGQIIKEERDPNDAPPDPNDKPEVKRVIGVIEEFRQNGELSTAGNYTFFRMRLDGPDPKADLPDRIFVRLKAGTPAAFEETLVKRAMAVATQLVVRGRAAGHDAPGQAAPVRHPAAGDCDHRAVPAADGGARPDRRRLAERDAADPRVRAAPRQGRHHRRGPPAGPGRDGDHDLAGAGRRRWRSWRSCRCCRCPSDLQMVAGPVFLASLAFSVAAIYLVDPGVRLVPEPAGDPDRAGRGATLRVTR